MKHLLLLLLCGCVDGTDPLPEETDTSACDLLPLGDVPAFSSFTEGQGCYETVACETGNVAFGWRSVQCEYGGSAAYADANGVVVATAGWGDTPLECDPSGETFEVWSGMVAECTGAWQESLGCAVLDYEPRDLACVDPPGETPQFNRQDMATLAQAHTWSQGKCGGVLTCPVEGGDVVLMLDRDACDTELVWVYDAATGEQLAYAERFSYASPCPDERQFIWYGSTFEPCLGQDFTPTDACAGGQ